MAGGSIPQERRGLTARMNDLDVEAEKHRDEEVADKKQNLLSVAYRNAIGCRLADGRIVTSVEQGD